MSRTDLLVTVAELSELLSDARRAPVVLDVRWTLQQPDGSAAFAQGHIPGARYVSLDDDLAAHPAGQAADPTAGRHPLPDFDSFRATASSWGIGADTPVIIYDDAAGMGAARAWWLLRWAGAQNVRLLDGGWAAWLDAQGDVETGAGTQGAVDAAGGQTPLADTPQLPTMDAAQAAQWSDAGVLLDARAAERFRGEVEPMDPVAGHIPGAQNRPAAANAPGGFWAGEAELRTAFAQLGADGTAPVGVYCGSGVTACHNAFALALIGQEATLYPASWSGWSADPDNPVATGE